MRITITTTLEVDENEFDARLFAGRTSGATSPVQESALETHCAQEWWTHPSTESTYTLIGHSVTDGYIVMAVDPR